MDAEKEYQKLIAREVSKLVGQSDLGGALKYLEKNVNLLEGNLERNSHDITLLSARLNRAERDRRAGTVDYRETDQERNRIATAMLEICNAKKPNVASTQGSQRAPGVTFKAIRDALKPLKDKKGKIDYTAAIEAMSELF